MPTISMFYGIIIRMCYAPKEHNPPHIHAYYQDHKATFTLQDCKLLEGWYKPGLKSIMMSSWLTGIFARMVKNHFRLNP